MRVLSIDPGATFGWALLGVEGGIESGFCRLPRGRVEQKWFALYRWLEALDPQSVDQVVYETYSFDARPRSGHQVAGGYFATLTNWCLKHDVGYFGMDQARVKTFTGCYPQTLKMWAHATSTPQLTTKNAVIEWVHGQGYSSATNHNESDAIALLLTYLALERNTRQVNGQWVSARLF